MLNVPSCIYAVSPHTIGVFGNIFSICFALHLTRNYNKVCKRNTIEIMAMIPSYPPSATNLSSQHPVSDQFPSGHYAIFTDKPVDELNRENLTFTMQRAHFCLKPYETCSDGMAVWFSPQPHLRLRKSCGECWALQDKLIKVLPDEDYKCFNLVHWGPKNKQHATMLGPLTFEQYGKCVQLITDKLPWITPFMTFHSYGGNDDDHEKA